VYGRLQWGYVAAIMLLGLLGALVLCMTHDETKRKIKIPQSIRPGPRALRYFFGSIPMALALIWFGWNIWLTIA
jgi:hypothetical protein